MEFISILFAHWIGDFLLQTRKMAVNKHKSVKWLSIHVLVYGIIIWCVGLLNFSWQVGLGYAVFNAGLHLVTDFFTSKLAAKYQDQPRIFYPILGFDQFIHVSCLYWTFVNSDILAL